MQILPAKELFPYIRHYLFLTSESESIKKLRLFTDGSTGIVFSFSNHLVADYKDNELPGYLPRTFVYGQLNSYKDIYLLGKVSLIIVVFQPWGLNQLFGIPADKLMNTVIPIEDFLGRQGVQLSEQLFDQAGFQDKADFLNGFFNKLIENNIHTNEVIRSSIQYIVQNRGLTTVQQLSQFTGYCERQMERKFNEVTGLNPKMFCSIIKLHSFLKYIKTNQAHNKITSCAYDAGYADQSHLIKEFRKYTGITPTEYISKATKLAVNLFEYTISEDNPNLSMSELYNFSSPVKPKFVGNLNNKSYGQNKNFNRSI